MDALPSTIRRICDDAGLPHGPERTWLETDIFLLADTLSALMSTRYMRLRLDVVTTNACRKFHIDAITARLVCTYRGSGTQYGVSRDDGDPEHIDETPTGFPILLRGTRWPPQATTDVLHRSPPIEGTGEIRLVLVLDPVFDMDDEI